MENRSWNASGSPFSSGRFPRYTVLLAAITAAMLMAGLAFAMAPVLAKFTALSPAIRESLSTQLIPPVRKSLQPEPVERWLFTILSLVSPFIVFASLLLVRSIRWKPPTEFLIGGILILAAVVELGLVHGASLLSFFFFPANLVVDQLVILLSVITAYYLTARPGDRFVYWKDARFIKSRSGKSRKVLVVAILVLIVLTLIPRGLSIHSVPSTKNVWPDHFQAVAFGLTQLFAGKPLLTAAPPLYGNYPVFLLPIFRCIGLSVFKFCVLMSLLLCCGSTALLTTGWKFIRIRILLALYIVFLFYQFSGEWLFGKLPFDPYFQYWPVRFLFPALSIPAFLWLTRSASQKSFRFWKSSLFGIFAGLALSWNLEAGIAVTAASLFTVIAERICARFRSRVRRSPARTGFRGAALIFLFCLGTYLGCWTYLHASAQWQKPLHDTVEYQQLFYQLGMMMTPLPMGLHPWWLVAFVYVLGMTFGLWGFLSGVRQELCRLVTYLTILGIGLFTYYQGRSHDYNLLSVCWPAMLLGFILSDRLLRAIRARMLAPEMRWLSIVPIYCGICAMVLFPTTFLPFVKFGIGHWKLAIENQSDRMTKRIDFIRASVGTASDCVILAKCQAVYFAETGLRSSFDMPGLSELFYESDLARLRTLLSDGKALRLVADAQTLEALGLKQIVAEHYEKAASSPDDELNYFRPRPTARALREK